MKLSSKVLVGAAGTLMLFAAALPLRAQDAGSPATVTLYLDRTTRQIFGAPGRDRIPLHIIGTPDVDAIAHQVEQKIEQKTGEQVRTAVAETQTQHAADTAALRK